MTDQMSYNKKEIHVLEDKMKEETWVPANIEHIIDYELKVKYVEEMIHAVKVNNEEILHSDVWGIIGEADKKCYALLMLQKKNMWDDLSEDSVRITHMSLSPGLFKEKLFLDLYIQIETYYINSNINSINISIPKNWVFTTKASQFFKKIGFKRYEEYNAHFPEGAILLVKSDLEKWYIKENGRYKPRTNDTLPV
jgi:hypothetical protein